MDQLFAAAERFWTGKALEHDDVLRQTKPDCEVNAGNNQQQQAAQIARYIRIVVPIKGRKRLAPCFNASMAVID